MNNRPPVKVLRSSVMTTKDPEERRSTQTQSGEYPSYFIGFHFLTSSMLMKLQKRSQYSLCMDVRTLQAKHTKSGIISGGRLKVIGWRKKNVSLLWASIQRGFR